MERGAWWAAVYGPHQKVTWGNLLTFPSFESTFPDEPNRPKTWKHSCLGSMAAELLGSDRWVNRIMFTIQHGTVLCLMRLEHLKGSFFTRDHFKAGPFLGIAIPLSFLCRIQKKGCFGLDILEGWLLKMVFAKLPSMFVRSSTPPMTFLQVPSLAMKLCSTSTEEKKNPVGYHMQIESESC